MQRFVAAASAAESLQSAHADAVSSAGCGQDLIAAGVLAGSAAKPLKQSRARVRWLCNHREKISFSISIEGSAACGTQTPLAETLELSLIELYGILGSAGLASDPLQQALLPLLSPALQFIARSLVETNRPQLDGAARSALVLSKDLARFLRSADALRVSRNDDKKTETLAETRSTALESALSELEKAMAEPAPQASADSSPLTKTAEYDLLLGLKHACILDPRSGDS